MVSCSPVGALSILQSCRCIQVSLYADGSLLNAYCRGHKHNLDHHLGVCSQPGSLQGGSQNSSKFQPVPRNLQNYQNAPQGVLNALKMTSQTVPESILITIKLQKLNLAKTSILMMFSAIPASDPGVISGPKSRDNRP